MRCFFDGTASGNTVLPYSIYIIELDPRVLTRTRFKKASPAWRPGRACLYVGSTFKDPEERFQQHKAGVRANRYVREFGIRPLPLARQHFGTFRSREEAERAEELVALKLREEGFAVWFGV
jgi:predicted GIY-YIG superfamily endonuclease